MERSRKSDAGHNNDKNVKKQLMHRVTLANPWQPNCLHITFVSQQAVASCPQVEHQRPHNSNSWRGGGSAYVHTRCIDRCSKSECPPSPSCHQTPPQHTRLCKIDYFFLNALFDAGDDVQHELAVYCVLFARDTSNEWRDTRCY